MSDQTPQAAPPAAAPAGPAANEERPKRRGAAVREIAIIIVVALIVSAVVRAFFFQAFYIPSGSMENTLLVNDRVLVSKIGQSFGDPNRGDIVVFRDPGGWLNPEEDTRGAVPKALHRALEIVGLAPSSSDRDVIKRVIGVGGDHVVCCDDQGRVTVNGVALDEGDYLFPGNVPSTRSFDVQVPEGRLFVLGDHRANSGDSSVHLNDPGQGTISNDDVVGRAVLRVWPLNRLSTLDVPDTFKNPALTGSTPGASAP